MLESFDRRPVFVALLLVSLLRGIAWPLIWLHDCHVGGDGTVCCEQDVRALPAVALVLIARWFLDRRDPEGKLYCKHIE